MAVHYTKKNPSGSLEAPSPLISEGEEGTQCRDLEGISYAWNLVGSQCRSFESGRMFSVNPKSCY